MWSTYKTIILSLSSRNKLTDVRHNTLYNIDESDDLNLESRRAIKNAYADISGTGSALLDQQIKGLANSKGNEMKDVTHRVFPKLVFNILAPELVWV